MQGKTALFDWLDTTLDELKTEQATITFHINGGAVEADLVTIDKELDNAGRQVLVKRTRTTHIRIERKGRVLNLAK